MTEKRPKKVKINPKSSQPYKRRTEEEMINILSQIQSGSSPKKNRTKTLSVFQIF
jgi:hypothetical protein